MNVALKQDDKNYLQLILELEAKLREAKNYESLLAMTMASDGSSLVQARFFAEGEGMMLGIPRAIVQENAREVLALLRTQILDLQRQIAEWLERAAAELSS